MTHQLRHIAPGDNLLGLDVVVNAAPFLRGIKACRQFTDKKDGGDSYTCVRVMPHGSTVVMSAANPLSMIVTGAQMVDDAYNAAGVLDLPVWMVDQLLTIFKTSSPDAQLRITAREGEQRVRFAESTGLFDVNVHQWGRTAMAETAPDVPAIIDEVFAQPESSEIPQVLTSTVTHQILQASKIMQTDVIIDQEPNHYRFRVGHSARAIAAIPDYVKESESAYSSEDIDFSDEELKSGRIVAATPPKGMA